MMNGTMDSQHSLLLNMDTRLSVGSFGGITETTGSQLCCQYSATQGRLILINNLVVFVVWPGAGTLNGDT